VAKPKNTSIEKVEKNTALAGPMEPWEERMLDQAKEDRANETSGIPRINHKNGKLTIDGKAVKDNKLPHVIADFVFLKEFYTEAYDPDVKATPVCYAMGRDDKNMVPHEAAPDKQAERCTGCPHNAFGTAEKGKGKRCKDVRRVLAAVAAPDSDLGTGEFRTYTIPPGSLKAWGQYLSKIPDIEPRYKNVRAVLTEMAPQDEEAGYSLTFRALERISREQVAQLQKRAAEMEPMLFAPYPVLSDEEKPKQAKRSAKASRKLD
jgi:hypothetical protein